MKQVPFPQSAHNTSNNVSMLARALFAVASSETMPDWQTYRTEVERARCRTYSSDQVPARMLDQLKKVIPRSDQAGCLRLTWSGHEPVLPARLTAALTSFVDDYMGAFPSEFFPEGEVNVLLEDVRDREPVSLAIPGQLAVAVAVTGNVFSAVVLLHATFRLLARGRDWRAYPAMTPMSIAERLRVGASVAPFRPDESPDGDPLGDTYHYWAMVTAGMFRPLIASSTGRGLFGGLFWSAPWLMSGVRRGIFRRTLFYGNHAAIDRLGLSHGEQLSRELERATSGTPIHLGGPEELRAVRKLETRRG